MRAWEPKDIKVASTDTASPREAMCRCGQRFKWMARFPDGRLIYYMCPKCDR